MWRISLRHTLFHQHFRTLLLSRSLLSPHLYPTHVVTLSRSAPHPALYPDI
ncbi:hypothetical protein HanRHA438_Chr08g0359531 [Helianthus annuus]|nr:hypothetical protein HanRHA438_Chr08g0359531 [Helianthus annuus]